MSNSIYKQILKKIKEYDEIVIARHIGPDPDAIASEVALREIIKYNYPEKKVFAVGTSVSRFKHIGSLDKIDESILAHALLIILDVPKFDRVDSAYKPRYDYTIKIDHHPCDEVVCDLELVDTESSSTCQLITELIYNTKLKINKDIAATLYLGVVADSDRFLLSYTTPRTLELCAKLLNDYKFDLMPLYDNLYERGINERKFEAYIINNLTITENGFGYIKVTNEIIKEYGVDSSTASNMVNNLNFIKELKVWAFSSYDEKSELFKINIRSRGIVINEIAERFNGGGHKFASGARLKTESDVDALFKTLDDACKE
ncbi:MAG: bifunctional oligoribonuclease/PAP phosphatase NrnA [Erysipelotrichales bacterium]|nr:bifunctional oligoribonuclease/PAP phosphatase NrnA [Erysipelotrichales bacterium]